MKFALVGNPNCGKTTVFNKLTGLNQKVGNWSGVTVDKKVGFLSHQNINIELVDIPGIYSLADADNSSMDEQIAIRHIFNDKPDAIINVVDASNLNRNLYLTLQLLETSIPVILVMNMADMANKKGLIIEYQKLSQRLGCIIVPIVASKGIGIKDLKKELVKTHQSSLFIDATKYPSEILAIKKILDNTEKTISNSLFVANQLTENKNTILRILCLENNKELTQKLNNLEKNTLDELVKSRYKEVNNIIKESVHKKEQQHTWHFSKVLDALCMHRFLGVPIFIFVMYLMFQFSITLGGALQPLFEYISHSIFVNGVAYLCDTWQLPHWVSIFLADGLGTGLNTVIAFIPQIGLLFLFISFLEDSGYMARAAFVMDKFMQFIGLSGKAFVPLIVGFGCNVASILSARTLETRKDRLMTIIMSPFISCGARLAIFSILATAFFPQNGANIIFLLYLVGIVIAIITCYIVKFTFLKGENTPFILEIPKYHVPRLSSILFYTWTKLKSFIIRAGKIIVPVCMFLVILNNIYIKQESSFKNTKNKQISALEYAGKTITPVLKPIGISDDNWPATVGLLTGVMAKEVVIGSLNSIYSNQFEQKNNALDYSFTQDLQDSLNKTWYNIKSIFSKETLLNPINAAKDTTTLDNSAMGVMVTKFSSVYSAFAYMLFILLYVPCVSVIASMRKESTLGWASMSVLWSLSIAYCSSLVVYQLSIFKINPFISIITTICACAYIFGLVFLMKKLSTSIRFTSKLVGCSDCGAEKKY